jgi:carboxylesterase
MGGLIATYLTVKYKQVKRLVLAAAAFEYLQFNNGEVDVVNSLKTTPDILKKYTPGNVISRVLSQPITAYKEFMDLSAMVKDLPKQITIPTLVIQGTEDEIVPPSSSQKIYQVINSKHKELEMMEGFDHDLFRGNKKEVTIGKVETFLKKPIINI